jgi:predicted TIM-barrel fold metal-dependent hydrolase
MQICDAHVHLGESGPWQPYFDPTIYVDDLINIFDKNDVERAVVFPNPNVGDKYPQMNDYIFRCIGKYPKRLVGFGRVDPRREDAVKELVRIKTKLHMQGLKLHPMVECFRPDHPYFDKFFEKANELEIPILIHTGDGFSSPSLISKTAEKYPRLPIILGHLREACLSIMQKFTNVYVETSGTLPAFVEQALDIDDNRVLFGSDVPYFRFETQLAIIDASKIATRAKRKVLFENFQKLFTERQEEHN